MIGQNFLNAPKTCGAGLGRGSISIALRETRDPLGPPVGRICGWRRQTPRTPAQRLRAIAFLTENLEGRLVPSGFASVSLSAVAAAVQSAAHSAAILAPDVPTPSNLGGTGAVLPPASTAPPALLEGAAAAATGGVLGAVDSVSRVVDADAAALPPLVDVSATISATVALRPIVPGVSNTFTNLVGQLDEVLDSRDGGAAAGSQGEGTGISITAGSGLVGTEISASVSNQGIALTLPGLSLDVKPPPSPLDPTGGFPVPSLPADLTPPGLLGNPVDNLTAPTNPNAPTPEGGSPAAPLPSSGNLGAGASPVASHAQSTGSMAGDAAQSDGNAAAAQPAAFVPNAGSAVSPSAVGDITSREPAPSTTGPSGSATVFGPANDGAAIGQGRVEHELIPIDSSSVDNGLPMAPGTARAELLPGDLESLERALAQLIRRFDGLGKDLAGLFTELGMTEMLVAAGMLVLAADAFRRWERRQRLTLPRAQSGSSGRPGPFYRPNASPFGRRGTGWMVDRPAIL
jgi:hypothetical protein